MLQIPPPPVTHRIVGELKGVGLSLDTALSEFWTPICERIWGHGRNSMMMSLHGQSTREVGDLEFDGMHGDTEAHGPTIGKPLCPFPSTRSL